MPTTSGSIHPQTVRSSSSSSSHHASTSELNDAPGPSTSCPGSIPESMHTQRQSGSTRTATEGKTGHGTLKPATVDHLVCLALRQLQDYFLSVTFILFFFYCFAVSSYVFPNLISYSPDDSRPGLSGTGGENAGTAMPRLPSCCQQHSPCGGPSPGHLSLSHSHSSCLQAPSSQQTGASQHGHSHGHSHGNAHHFIHHVHHPAPQPPGTLPFQEPSCPVERPSALPAPCAGVSSSSNNSSSSNTGHYHDQVRPCCAQFDKNVTK